MRTSSIANRERPKTIYPFDNLFVLSNSWDHRATVTSNRCKLDGLKLDSNRFEWIQMHSNGFEHLANHRCQSRAFSARRWSLTQTEGHLVKVHTESVRIRVWSRLSPQLYKLHSVRRILARSLRRPFEDLAPRMTILGPRVWVATHQSGRTIFMFV